MNRDLSMASCREIGHEPFFTEDVGIAQSAKAICRTCPVQDLCLDVAVNDPSLVGIWGGTTPKERQQIRKRRKIAA